MDRPVQYGVNRKSTTLPHGALKLGYVQLLTVVGLYAALIA
jgi:hypothetical protein